MTNRAWGGRFTEGPGEDMRRMSSSLAEDALLVREDILGSLAHVRALARAGVVSESEAASLGDALRAVLQDVLAGRATLVEEHEDVHMNVEVLLRPKSPAAGKLHTARSRNDQVATDLKLWTRNRLLDMAAASLDLADAALAKAEEHAATPAPGFTHLQPAQPVSLGHHFAAHAERALRDAERAWDAFRRANVSPLGAGALAGTSFPIDPAATARDLAFDAAFANSLDAVSDRDFAAEATFVAALAHVHLAGLGEELVIWSTPQFGFVELSEQYSTGSSIMPQKRNPDAAEILRGRAGPAQGDLISLLGTLKGLPLAYNRDLQEAKAPLLRALPRAIESARVAARVVASLRVDNAAMETALQRGHLEATEIADYLARKGLPFRDAHHVVGALVKEADARGVRVGALPLDVIRKASPLFGDDVASVLDPRRAHEAKDIPGGAAPGRVREAVGEARSRAKALRAKVAAKADAVAAAEMALLGAAWC